MVLENVELLLFQNFIFHTQYFTMAKKEINIAPASKNTKSVAKKVQTSLRATSIGKTSTPIKTKSVVEPQVKSIAKKSSVSIKKEPIVKSVATKKVQSTKTSTTEKTNLVFKVKPAASYIKAKSVTATVVAKKVNNLNPIDNIPVIKNTNLSDSIPPKTNFIDILIESLNP